MHRPGRRALLVTLLALCSLLVCSVAFAQITVTYGGEAPDIGRDIDWYGGDHASNFLWDYVYHLSATSPQYGPFYWGIAVDFQPEDIWNDEDGDWTGAWDPEVTGTEYAGHFAGTGLEGVPAVVWTYSGDFGTTPPTGTFHFRSDDEPALRPWVAYSTNSGYSGSGSQWSASPEPASMALTSLCLVGVAVWRRRRGAT